MRDLDLIETTLEYGGPEITWHVPDDAVIRPGTDRAVHLGRLVDLVLDGRLNDRRHPPIRPSPTSRRTQLMTVETTDQTVDGEDVSQIDLRDFGYPGGV